MMSKYRTYILSTVLLQILSFGVIHLAEMADYPIANQPNLDVAA